jgi:SprT protein
MKEQIKKAVEAAFVKVENCYNVKLPRPKISFDLNGRAAGTASRGENKLRFNLSLAEHPENKERFLRQTVPHEVAHLAQDVLFPSTARGWTKPHGREWQRIMVQAMGLPPERCHSYNTENIKARRKHPGFPYKCGCRTFIFSPIRHKRAQSGKSYYSCPKCKQKFIYENNA